MQEEFMYQVSELSRQWRQEAEVGSIYNAYIAMHAIDYGKKSIYKRMEIWVMRTGRFCSLTRV